MKENILTYIVKAIINLFQAVAFFFIIFIIILVLVFVLFVPLPFGPVFLLVFFFFFPVILKEDAF